MFRNMSEFDKLLTTLDCGVNELKKEFTEKFCTTLSGKFLNRRNVEVTFEDTEENYTVVVTGLTGIKKEDLEVQFWGTTLTVEGSCNQSIGEANEDGHSYEEYKFSFKKTIPINIGEGVTVLSAKFDSDSGILRVNFPSKRPKVNDTAFKVTIE